MLGATLVKLLTGEAPPETNDSNFGDRCDAGSVVSGDGR